MPCYNGSKKSRINCQQKQGYTMKTLIIASFAVLIQFSLVAAIVPAHSQKRVLSYVVAAQHVDLSRVPAVLERNK